MVYEFFTLNTRFNGKMVVLMLAVNLFSFFSYWLSRKPRSQSFSRRVKFKKGSKRNVASNV